MPGGRLTRQDRRQIAQGLADGLAYAEMARRLDRPTSTITREVLRNGGPAAYRADLAHHRAKQRARRQTGNATRGASHPPATGGRDADAVREYEETFTTLLMRSGLPRMMSRVLTCLYVADTDSLTVSDLVQRLRVSPASVSKAVAFLEDQGLIRRERGEGRRERYLVDGDVFHRSVIASARSNKELAETARRGVGVLGPGGPAADRLGDIARFVDFVAERLFEAADQARDLVAPGDGPSGPEGRRRRLGSVPKQ